MSKKFTSFLVVLAALLLTVPTQAQFAKKAAKQTTVLKAGPLKVNDVQKVKAAKMKAAAKYEGQAFTSKVFNSYLQAGLEKVQEDKAILEKQMEENLRATLHGNANQLTYGKLFANVQFGQTHQAKFDAVQSGKQTTRRAGGEEVVDEHGVITAIPEGETKLYQREGIGWYRSGSSLYYTDQAGTIEITELEDGTVYFKDFFSQAATGAYIKGTKNGNTITVPSGQVIYYWASSGYGMRTGFAEYTSNGFVETKAGDPYILTIDGNTISLTETSFDFNTATGTIAALLYTDDNTFCGYGDNSSVFTYDPEYVAPQPIELPDGLTVETWYNNGTKVTNSGSAPYTQTTAKVAFDGNDVYLSGIFANYPDSWIKGTIDGTNVTFSGLQYLGDYSGFNIFAVGTDGEGLVDFQMTYDAAAQTLTAVNGLLANAAEDRIYYLEWYEDVLISKDEPVFEEPTATTGANVDALPYSNALDSETAFADFGVLDSNSDGKTWIFSADNGTYYGYSSANAADDWLISPAIKLEAGKKYHFAIDAASASTSYPEVFEVLIGTEPKASALTQSVLAATQVASKEFATYENETVEVAETGYYHFGIHAISDANMWNLFVANFLVEAGAEPTAPAAVTDFAVAQTPDKLEAVVSFKAPAKTVGGDDLTDLTKIEVLRDGKVIKSLGGAEPISWDASAQGYENAQDVAAIDFGSGLTATMASGGNSNTPKYYTSGTALRMYGNNTMTITGSAIKKVVITMTGNDNQKQLTANVGEYALEGNVGTWTGSADKIVFTVVEGKQARIQKIEIETGLTLTPGAEYSVVDAEGLTVGNHVYQVIPYNTTGVGVKSEEKSIFISVSLEAPYTFDFSTNLLDLFTVIDNNNDGKTWSWNASSGVANYSYSSENDADDYLVTLPFNLKAGKRYNVIVNAKGSASYPERFEVKAGKEGTVAGLTEQVIAPTDLNTGEFDDYEGVFAPEEDGLYFFAIHAISDADMLNLQVKTLIIELAPELTAPAAVADLTATAGAEGALEATLAFTAPSKDIKGDALTGNVDVKIYRDNELVNTLTGVAAGSAQSWKDTNVENGKTYTYYVVAANESGDGLKSEKKSVFVGVDEVGDVANILVTGTTANTISLKWDEVAGKNGGYVNLADVRYAAVSMHVETYWVFQYLVVDEVLGTVTGATSGTFNYPVDEGVQDWSYIGVVALQGDAAAPEAGSEYAGGYTAVLVGSPYTMPFVESFANQTLAYDIWTYGGAEDTYVSLTDDASDDDGGAVLMTTYEAPGTARLESGKIKIEGANPTLIFDAKATGITSGKIMASVDDAEWTVVKSFDVTDTYQPVKVSLLNAKGERFTRIAFAADIVNPSEYQGQDPSTGAYIFDWKDVLYIDNIKVVDLYEYNLVADIKAPKSVVAGQKAKIVATVSNEGENPVKDYIVTITAGNKALTNVIGDKELAPFTKDIIEVDYETSIFDETGDVTLTVNVQYENELLPEDNTASAIITITEPAVTAPASLIAEDKGADGVDLTWAMPETASARAAAEPVTESFETEGDMGGFTTIDADGDGYNWGQHINTGEQNFATQTGDGSVFSASYVNNVGALTPDNWLITPAATLDGTFSFYACGQDASYAAEHFAVFVSTTVADDPSAFTQVSDEFIATGEMTEYTVDLSQFAGQTGYIAIRHFNVTDMFYLVVDDVTYIPAGDAPVVAPTAFNIYYNNEKIATVDGDKTTYTVAADKVEVGTQTFGVSAVYANGAESRVTTATIEIVTGIEQIAADGKPVDVYSIDGKLIRNQAKSLDGLKGLYIVNGKKIMVK